MAAARTFSTKVSKDVCKKPLTELQLFYAMVMENHCLSYDTEIARNNTVWNTQCQSNTRLCSPSPTLQYDLMSFIKFPVTQVSIF
jgi:hypothetical protein